MLMDTTVKEIPFKTRISMVFICTFVQGKIEEAYLGSLRRQ